MSIVHSGVDVSVPTVVKAVSLSMVDLAAHSGTSLLDAAADLGRKGAAFAALGDIPVDFFPLALTFSVADKKDGVKLGESTLNDFFILSLLVPVKGKVFSFLTCPPLPLLLHY